MHIESIHVHPIKSCRGVAVASATLDSRGLIHDRRLMIVDEHDRFLSLRTEPRLARVRLALGDGDADGGGVRDATSYLVRIPAADAGAGAGDATARDVELRVPCAVPLRCGPERRVTVWSDTVDAVEHREGSELFSRFLRRPVRLVYMAESADRAVNPARARPGDRVGLADAYPLLMLSRASVDDVSAHVGATIDVERFRPNLVLAGATPYAEDRFAEIRIGEVGFRGPKACDRCVATTVDPATGETGREPMRTLARIRRAHGKVWLGMNLIHDGVGTLHVGDPVSVQRMHDAPAFL